MELDRTGSCGCNGVYLRGGCPPAGHSDGEFADGLKVGNGDQRRGCIFTGGLKSGHVVTPVGVFPGFYNDQIFHAPPFHLVPGKKQGPRLGLRVGDVTYGTSSQHWKKKRSKPPWPGLGRQAINSVEFRY